MYLGERLLYTKYSRYTYTLYIMLYENSRTRVLKGAPKKRNEIRDREHRYQSTKVDKERRKDVPVPTWNPGGP